MSDDTPPHRNPLAAFLARLPIIGYGGRCLAEERFVELAFLLVCLLMAVVLALLVWGPPALILTADIMAALAFTIILALTFE